MGKIILSPDDLEDSLMGKNMEIDFFLKEDITKPYSQCEAIGGFLWSLVSTFRSHGILIHLTDADINGFFEDMNRSSLTYITFLQAYHHKMDVSEARYHGSFFYPIVCALVSGNYEAAKEIDRLMPQEFNPAYDSEVWFSYTMMIRKLVVGTDEEVASAFKAFEKECAGLGRWGHKVTFVRALLDKDTDGFNQAVYDYLETFNDISFEEANEMSPGDESIDLESLAFIQLAKRKGMDVNIPHRMVPAELQIARLLIPDSGYPTWPE